MSYEKKPAKHVTYGDPAHQHHVLNGCVTNTILFHGYVTAGNSKKKIIPSPL